MLCLKSNYALPENFKVFSLFFSYPTVAGPTVQENFLECHEILLRKNTKCQKNPRLLSSSKIGSDEIF